MDLENETVRHVFELEKTAVNQDDLARQITKNLKKHHLDTPNQWPTFTLASTLDGYHSDLASLQEAFNRATKSYDTIEVALSFTPSDRSLMARIKRPFHQLVVFYANRLGQKQIKFNDHTLRLFNQLIASNAKKDTEIKELQSQLKFLQNRIQEIDQGQ